MFPARGKGPVAIAIVNACGAGEGGGEDKYLTLCLRANVHDRGLNMGFTQSCSCP